MAEMKMEGAIPAGGGEGLPSTAEAPGGDCAPLAAGGSRETLSPAPRQDGPGDAGAPERAGEDERLAPLERVRDLESERGRLRDELAQRDEEVERLRSSLHGAAMKYRQALLAAYPVIPEELLSGGTVEELEESLERARSAVEAVRRKLEEDMARSLAVPPGAPVRRGPDLEALSPREKILYGLRRA